MTRVALALALSAAVGCASAARSAGRTTVDPAVVLPASEELSDEAVAALEALAASGRRGDTDLGVTLPRSAGALALTGDPAPDDRLAEVTVAARAGRSAAVLAVTACGNVWLVGARFDGGRWTTRPPVAVSDDARPGACRTTRAEAAARAMLTEAPREVVVTFASESEDGGEARDPALRLFHLAPDGTVNPLGGEVALGGTDDHSGAVRDGQWVIEETLMAPRDLYVQIQPGRVGPGGTAPPVVIRRTYRVEGASLRLVEENSAPYRTAVGGAPGGARPRGD